jgi:hypothetical protein
MSGPAEVREVARAAMMGCIGDARERRVVPL